MQHLKAIDYIARHWGPRDGIDVVGRESGKCARWFEPDEFGPGGYEIRMRRIVDGVCWGYARVMVSEMPANVPKAAMYDLVMHEMDAMADELAALERPMEQATP